MSSLMNVMIKLSSSGVLLGIAEDIGNAINRFVFGLLYGLCKGIWWILDAVQIMFRKFAGLDVVYDVSGNEIGNDIIVMLFQSNLAKNILFSIMGVGVVLLFVFCVIAIIRNVYKEEKNVTVGSIIGNALKGLMGYLFVPFICMFGILFSNVILQGIDSATSQPGATTFSSRIFLASAYNANVFREESAGLGKWSFESAVTYANTLNNSLGDTLGFKVDTIVTEEDLANFADIIDFNFANNFPNATEEGSIALGTLSSLFPSNFDNNVLTMLIITSGTEYADMALYKNSTISPYNDMRKVSCCYNLWKFNYIYAIAGTLFVAYAIIILCFGLIKRIYKLLIYYLISPFMLSMYPLDNGEAFKKWRSEFVGYVVGAYAAIGILNLFIFTLPILDQVYLFGGGNWNPLNGLVQLLLLIVGALTVKELVSTVSGWIGGKDLSGEGKTMMGDVGKATAKVGKGILTPTGYITGAVTNQRRRDLEAQKAGNEAADKAREKGANENTINEMRNQAMTAARKSSSYKSIGQSLGGLASSWLGKSEGTKAFNEGMKLPQTEFPFSDLQKSKMESKKLVDSGLAKLTEKEIVKGVPVSKGAEDFVKGNKFTYENLEREFKREQRHAEAEKNSQLAYKSSLNNIIQKIVPTNYKGANKILDKISEDDGIYKDYLENIRKNNKLTDEQKKNAFEDMEKLRKSVTSQQDAEVQANKIDIEMKDIKASEENYDILITEMAKRVGEDRRQYGDQNVNYEKIAKAVAKTVSRKDKDGKDITISKEQQDKIVEQLIKNFPSKK